MFRRKSTDDDRIAKLEQVVKRLCDDVDAIDDKLTKVRGLIYAKKIHKTGLQERDDGQTDIEDVAPPTDTSKMNRAELKRWLTQSGRFTPGKPPQHD